MKQKTPEWLPLSQHERWSVEYCLEQRQVRLRLGEQILQVDRETFLLLWATLTEGLDAMEMAEDEANRVTGLLRDSSRLHDSWSQTRH